MKPIGRDEPSSLAADMSLRRTPQTSKSCRKAREEPDRWPAREKCWTTPRRRAGDKDRFSENAQTSENKGKLKPQSLFTPPRHYREEVWPKATQAALSPINVNGPLTSKDGEQGKSKPPDTTPSAKVVPAKGDLVPSLSASGRRVQFGSRPKSLRCKELFEADRDPDQNDNQKTLVWNNPTFCEERSCNETASTCHKAYPDAGTQKFALAANSELVIEKDHLPSAELGKRQSNTEYSTCSTRASIVPAGGSTSATSTSMKDKTTTVLFSNNLSERKEIVALVEGDLEAEIRRNIEEEIENEIRMLSGRLAELHARQGVRQTDRDQFPDVALSCPQTPILAARRHHTPERVQFLQDFATETNQDLAQESSGQDGSVKHANEGDFPAPESSICKHRKGRTVSAKFLNWNKQAGVCTVKSEDRKSILKTGVISGPSSSSIQYLRRGLSLGGGTLSTTREASTHKPCPRGLNKPSELRGFSATGSRTHLGHVQLEESTQNVGKVGSGEVQPDKDSAADGEPGKVQKLANQLHEEDSSKSSTRSAALSSWFALGASKRFDWIRTLRSGGEGSIPAKQLVMSKAIKVEDQEVIHADGAVGKPKHLIGKGSPVSPLILDRSTLEPPKSGSRIVPSRYGSSPVMAADVQKGKGADLAWKLDSKVRTDGAPNSRPAPCGSTPAKPLKNENMKCRAALSGNATGVASKVTPQGRSVRSGGHHRLIQGRDLATVPPLSQGKSTVRKGAKRESVEKLKVEGSVGEAAGSPDPRCDLLAKFHQLAISTKDAGRSKSQASRGKGEIPRRRCEDVGTFVNAAAPPHRKPSAYTPTQCMNLHEASSAFSLQRPEESELVTTEDFSTPWKLRLGRDDGTDSVTEEFWTPAVLLSPPTATGSPGRKGLLPVVTELRSHLNSSPGLKKFHELLKDLDSLDVERRGLPQIATKSLVGLSPRDSGCVKRVNDRSEGHPWGSRPDSLDHEHSLEALAARFAINNSASDVGAVAGLEGGTVDARQEPLVGCLETYAQEGEWEHGAVMQQLRKNLLPTCVKGNVACRKSAQFRQQTDAAQLSEWDNLWHLVEKLDKERRDSVYEMLSRQLAKIQQGQA